MDHFKQAAPTWDTPEKIETNKMYAEKIKSHLKFSTRLKILEVGCGTGLLGSQFLSSENQILGIDTSEDMLKIFQQKFSGNKNIKSKLFNLEEDGLLEGSFDLVISSMAFHHLKNPEKVLQKLQRLLSKNGVIAIIDLDQEDGSFHPDPKVMGVHHFGFEKNKVLKWGKDLQFTNVEHEIINVISKNEKKYPVFLAIFKNN